MPFDFFLRFQRNYIQNAIKAFDKTLSQLFLVFILAYFLTKL